MEKLINVVTNTKNAEEMIAHYQHFGYVLRETRQSNGDKVVLYFEKMYSQNRKKLDQLKSLYDKMNRKVPISAIIWMIIGCGFIAGYITLLMLPETKDYAGFAIPFFIICFAIAIFLLILFIVIVTNQKEIKARIILEADRLEGAIKEVPYTEYIAPATEQTGLISRNIDSIINSNVR